MGRIGLLCHGSNLHRFGIGSNGLGSTLKNAKFKGDNILISTQVHSTQFDLSQFDLSYSTKRVDLILFDLFHSTHFMQSVETGIGEIDLNDNNSTTQWKTFLNLLLDASEEYIPLKTTSRHSKPFWNSELTKSSEELRHLRRKFKFCSNYINGEKLASAKVNFKKQLSDSASIWMSCFLSNLGHKRGRDFWASYKSLPNKKKEEVGLIRNKTGELLYTKSENCTQCETTFFSGQHLSKQYYYEGFFEHVEQEVRVPDSSDELENGLFVDPLNMEELNAAIANTSY